MKEKKGRVVENKEGWLEHHLGRTKDAIFLLSGYDGGRGTSCWGQGSGEQGAGENMGNDINSKGRGGKPRHRRLSDQFFG